MIEIKNLLEKRIYEKYIIEEKRNFSIELIPAKELIVSNRIDLAAKLTYIDHKIRECNMSWATELYKRHIEAFSNGTYSEPGDDNKNTIEDYLQTFDKLIFDIKTFGFDQNRSIIPVGDDNSIMNGSHRVSICAYFNLKIPIIRFNDVKISYNYEFFKNRLLEEKYLDYMAYQYIKQKNNIYIACVWPIANIKKNPQNEALMIDIINKSANIVYKKHIKINYTGMRNLLVDTYHEYSWTGSIENNFIGVKKYADTCYETNNDLFVYILESESLSNIIEIKKRIRTIFNIGNKAIHITDTKEEAIRLGGLLLNNNSIHLLNYGKPDYDKDLYYRIQKFKTSIIDCGLSIDDFVVDSSSTLGLYGLRKIGDLDFLSISNNYNLIESFDINNHHDYLNFYEKSLSELIVNPENYLFYNEIKFSSIKIIKNFKKNRKDMKDMQDLKLISLIPDKEIKLKNNLDKIVIKSLKMKRDFKRKFLAFIVKLSKRRFFKIPLKFYHLLRYKKWY